MIDQWKIIEKYGRFFFNGGTPTKMDSSKIAGSYLSMDDNSGVTPTKLGKPPQMILGNMSSYWNPQPNLAKV